MESNAKQINVKEQLKIHMDALDAMVSSMPDRATMQEELQKLAAYAKLLGISQMAVTEAAGYKSRGYVSTIISGNIPHKADRDVMERIYQGYKKLLKDGGYQ